MGCGFVAVILAFEQDVSKGESQHGQVDLLMLPNLFKVLGKRWGIGACIGRTRGAYMHTIVLVRWRGWRVGRGRTMLAMLPFWRGEVPDERIVVS